MRLSSTPYVFYRLSLAEPFESALRNLVSTLYKYNCPAMSYLFLAKERSGFGDRGGGGGVEDDSKFDSPWRRDGPLPDLPRDSRRRYDGASPGDRERLPSVAEGASEWRSNRPSRPAVSEDLPPRRRSGFSTPEGQPGPADQAETWIRGSKFAPAPNTSEERFGSLRGKGDMGPPKDLPADEADWRARKSSISRMISMLLTEKMLMSSQRLAQRRLLLS